jgi:hypothetical protein
MKRKKDSIEEYLEKLIRKYTKIVKKNEKNLRYIG